VESSEDDEPAVDVVGDEESDDGDEPDAEESDEGTEDSKEDQS
jgi:hypothetical protein